MPRANIDAVLASKSGKAAPISGAGHAASTIAPARPPFFCLGFRHCVHLRTKEGLRNCSSDASSLPKQCDCIALIQLARRLLQILVAPRKQVENRNKVIADTAKLHTSAREDHPCSR